MLLPAAELVVPGLGSREGDGEGRAGRCWVQRGELGSSPDPHSKPGPVSVAEGQSQCPEWALGWFVDRNTSVPCWLWAQHIIKNDELIQIVVMETGFPQDSSCPGCHWYEPLIHSPLKRAGLCKQTGGRDPGRRQNRTLCEAELLSSPSAAWGSHRHPPSLWAWGWSHVLALTQLSVPHQRWWLRLNYAIVILCKMHHKTYSCLMLAWESYCSLYNAHFRKWPKSVFFLEQC